MHQRLHGISCSLLLRIEFLPREIVAFDADRRHMPDDVTTCRDHIVRRPPLLEAIDEASDFLEAADMEEVLFRCIVWFGHHGAKSGQSGLETDGPGERNRDR